MTTTSGPLARDPDVVTLDARGAVYPRPMKGTGMDWQERIRQGDIAYLKALATWAALAIAIVLTVILWETLT